MLLTRVSETFCVNDRYMVVADFETARGAGQALLVQNGSCFEVADILFGECNEEKLGEAVTLCVLG